MIVSLGRCLDEQASCVPDNVARPFHGWLDGYPTRVFCLLDVIYRERECHRREYRCFSEEDAWAFAPPETKRKVARVVLGGALRRREETVWAERHGVRVAIRIVQQVPVRIIVRVSTEKHQEHGEDRTYQTLTITIVPFGTKYPACTSSSVV